MINPVSEMPDELNDESKLALWREFHKKDLFGPETAARLERGMRLIKIQNLYDNDDIFRREIDGLKERMQKKKMKIKEVEKKIEELASEGEYRRYMATFDQMKKNFEARKGEMAKIKEAFS